MLFCRRFYRMMKRVMAPISSMAPKTAPIPIPAFAPVDNPVDKPAAAELLGEDAVGTGVTVETIVTVAPKFVPEEIVESAVLMLLEAVVVAGSMMEDPSKEVAVPLPLPTADCRCIQHRRRIRGGRQCRVLASTENWFTLVSL